MLYTQIVCQSRCQYIHIRRTYIYLNLRRQKDNNEVFEHPKVHYVLLIHYSVLLKYFILGCYRFVFIVYTL